MRKLIALADCNNFFVSCEILKNPSLKGKPVCVLSNCDGCVISRSNEAKKLGITMGMPLFKAKKEFPEAFYLSSDFKFYHNISKKVQLILKDFSPLVETASIDEAFLDVTNLHKLYGVKNYYELAKLLHENIYNQIGIPVSVGISTSKILSKIAVDKAKKSNFYYFLPFEKIEEEISNYEVGNIWGVGKNIKSLLLRHGIFTAGDILKKDKEFFEYHLGKRGLELKFGLEGENTIPIALQESKPKSIQKTSSFIKPTNSRDFLKNSLLNHMHNVCKKMRKYNLKTRVITVMLRTKDFRVITASDTVERLSNSEYLMNKYVLKLFNQIYSEHILYRSSGIYVFNLEDCETEQMNFFDEYKDYDNLSNVLDKLETKYGEGILSFGL